MEIQFVPTHDSEDEGWIEVLEGSPGPSLPASPTFESIKSTESALFELEVIESISENNEMRDFEEVADGGDVERNSTPNRYPRHSTACYNSPEQYSRSLIDMNLLQQPAVLDRPLNLDRPEIGDVVGHCHEVYGKRLSQSDEADCYQSWLCCMYCMTWNQIWDLVSHAPDYVVHAANHLFGLQNHPFWSDRRNWHADWHLMHEACRDVVNLWKESRLSDEPRRNAIRISSARNTMALSGVSQYDEIELYYGLLCAQEKQVVAEQPTSDQENIATADQFMKIKHHLAAYEKMPKGQSDSPDQFHNTSDSFSSPYKWYQPLTDTKEHKATTSPTQTETLCALPWPSHQVTNYVIRKYRSFDKRPYDEVISYGISFETWVHWNQDMYKNRTHSK